MSLIFATVSLAAISGCRSAGEDGPEVVATTTQVADLARNVAGDRAEVEGILPAGSDPHDYEPRPSDAAAIASARIIITSGGEVDEWAEDLIESSGTEARVVTLSDSFDLSPDADGRPDPHWWQDAARARAAVLEIRDALSEVDPPGDGDYARNAAAYAEEISATDESIHDCMAQVPDEARKLVTAHDSLGYLADRYAVEVVGAAIPALSSQAQPSAGETAELVGLIRTEDVRAVFAEAGLPDDLERAIAADADVAFGGELYADSLGGEGTPGETYLGALRSDAATLIEGFSNGAPLSCPALGLDR
ncbi:MAG: zinc ABC transporter substrate-binding protein [Solirubrobacterales bacterium]